MAIKEIARTNWASYFDAFSRKLTRSHRTDYAEVRVFSMEIGAQPETTWLPLTGITYDRKDDLLEVSLPAMDHLIPHPETIYVDETDGGLLTSFEVIRRDGTKEVIELR